MATGSTNAYAVALGHSISRLLGLYMLTQAELAQQVGTSPQTMTNIVRGQVEARARTYREIFGFFGLERNIEDFERALPEIVAVFPEIEKKAARIRRKRSK